MRRQKFHITPTKGLLNDPNGLIFWNDEYHLFFQWNPHSCEHGSKYWAHLKSKDLVVWENLPPALSPESYYDKNGCYSGSAIEKDGMLYLVYTGNVKKNGIRESYQCLAKSADGINFTKLGPIIDNKDIPKGYTKHFRDPKVLKKGDFYYLLLGAQRIDLTGTIVLYKSSDLFNWTFLGEVLKSNFGFMCECPDYIEDSNLGALIFSPQGLTSKGDLYNNLYQSGYIIDDLNLPIQSSNFIELDRGFEFYAPQTFLDKNNINTLIAWMGMPEELNHPTISEENWVHCLTIPREIQISNKKLYQRPHRNLKSLRKEKIILKNVLVNNFINLKKYGIQGETYELILKVTDITCNFNINIRVGKNNKTVFTFDKNRGKIVFDRTISGSGNGGIRKVKIENNKEVLFHFFVDYSSVELFINDGEEVFTGNIYPDSDAIDIQIESEQSFEISELEFYKI